MADARVPCPACIDGEGWIFQDARGGYECNVCDARFVIDRELARGYGGPRGPLTWLERNEAWFDRLGWAFAGVAVASPSLVSALSFFAIQFALLALWGWARRDVR